jgi:hypothetical protein
VAEFHVIVYDQYSFHRNIIVHPQKPARSKELSNRTRVPHFSRPRREVGIFLTTTVKTSPDTRFLFYKTLLRLTISLPPFPLAPCSYLCTHSPRGIPEEFRSHT